MDVPNARSSHTNLTPRGGGIVFVSLWIITLIIASFMHALTPQEALIFLPGTLLVATTGFLDDRYNLSARIRATTYLAAAIISVIALGGFSQIMLNTHDSLALGFFGSVIAVLFITWSINLFNFMDGLDGLAALQALFVLGVGGFFIAESGGTYFAMLIWGLAVCVAGFLIWNKPPAKIFMGDVGSTTLGFVIAVLALWSEKKYGVPLLLWLILYGAFLTDTTLTVIRRLLAKQPIYQAHRSHAYQRLHQAGFSHTTVLMWMGGVYILLSLIALLGFYYRDFLWGFALMAFGILLGLYVWVERINPMRH